ncbi:MAG: hypothetical protein BMS9Abin37_3064 [Acidobacteriota bacterium]|nr:MAG: hypothetical protein BMS9Abin37_3064 [Acidobacteriota bacterium]
MPVTRTPKITDTSRDAQRVLLELLRAAPPWHKLQMVDVAGPLSQALDEAQSERRRSIMPRAYNQGP